MLPAAAVDAIEAVLKGATLVEAGAALTVSRSRAHGHVALVHAAAQQLRLPALLGPPRRERDLAYALIISRVVAPRPKLATLAWWDDVTLGADLGIADAPRDAVYAAMDWLLGRQDPIEAELARRHLREGGIAMFDLSSSWVEGSRCELAARGYSRDGKKGREQIEYGLLTDPQGRPVAIRVFAGNTADPAAFIQAVDVVRGKFALRELVMVGDRGMITSARIRALKELGGLSWITCLRAPAIRKLADDGGPLQLSLFDQQDLAEIISPDYPGERLIACRNPRLAAERARKREYLLTATEALLATVKDQAVAGRIRGADKIGVRAGKVIAGTRSPSTSSSISAMTTSPGGATRPPSTPRPPWTASTSSAPPSRPANWTPPPPSPPTRTSPASNATSATSRLTTWTCAPSTTGSKAGSAATS